MEEHIYQQNNFSAQLLEGYTVGGEDCLPSLVMGDETWFYPLNIETT
jgi:hypothetical protein